MYQYDQYVCIYTPLNMYQYGEYVRIYKYRVAKMHRMPYFYVSISAKEPCNSCLFRGTRPAAYGILCSFAPPCIRSAYSYMHESRYR